MSGTDWIRTFTGREFWPLRPKASDVDIRDIAHALSMQCRFTGHVKSFYSVAQHCVAVSKLCHPLVAGHGLLHDASEAYMADVARPIKHMPTFAPYRVAELRLQSVIYDAFGLSLCEPTSVKVADKIMLATEARDLMHTNWRIDDYPPDDAIVVPLLPDAAKRLFLDRFAELFPAHQIEAA